MNRYLFTPPSSEHPQHSSYALVYGELLRYVVRSTRFEYYADIATAFYERLRARGFSASFCAEAFSRGPEYANRSRFLDAIRTDPTTSTDLPTIVFSTVYSKTKYAAGLSRAIFGGKDLLPPDFPPHHLVNAWQIGAKIGSKLIRHRYPRVDEGFTPPPLR